MNTSNFNDTWAPTWVVQDTIPGAIMHITTNTTRTFKTGRPVKEVVFFDEHRREVARREGMLLTSRKGNEYAVCLREAPTKLPRNESVAETVGELFDDL